MALLDIAAFSLTGVYPVGGDTLMVRNVGILKRPHSCSTVDPAGRFLPALVEPVDPAEQVDSEQVDSAQAYSVEPVDSAVQAWVAAKFDSAQVDSAQADSVWLALVAAECPACPALPAGWKAVLHSVAGCYSVVDSSPGGDYRAHLRDGPARPLAWKSGGSQVWVAGS
jgi:hypothetical protein